MAFVWKGYSRKFFLSYIFLSLGTTIFFILSLVLSFWFLLKQCLGNTLPSRATKNKPRHKARNIRRCQPDGMETTKQNKQNKTQTKEAKALQKANCPHAKALQPIGGYNTKHK